MSGGPTIAHVNDIAFVGSTLVAELRRRGVRARLVESPKPAASWPYPWKWLAAPARVPAMAAVARGLGDADLVHVHYATHGLIGRLSGRPYVVHCHGSDVRGVAIGSMTDRVLRSSIARAGLVLFSTPDLAVDIARYRDDAVFLPNPIDVDRFRPASRPDRDVLLATRLDPIKGATAAMAVLDRLLALRPETTATVLLDGPLARVAMELFEGRVQFAPRRMHVEMPALYQAHRVAIGQFKLGILSQVELEAMATGCCVAVPLLYPDALGERPPTVPAEDPAKCAAAIASLLDDPSRLANGSAAGRDWVIRHHDVTAVVDRLGGLYGRAFGIDVPAGGAVDRAGTAAMGG